MKTIACIGLGAMGSRMARNLIDAGYEVRAYNRSAEPREALNAHGGTTFATPREAAEGADVVVAIVTDIAASADVWLDPDNGALAGMKPGAIAVESSTLTPDWIADLDERFDAAGVRFVDAPVAGTTPQAKAATLQFLVGGDEATVDALREVLGAMGQAVHHLGPVGAGATMKLAVNGLFAVQVAAWAEVLGLAERAGVSVADAVAFLEKTAVTSPIAKVQANAMAQRSFAPMFPVSLVEKDLGYGVDACARRGQWSPVLAGARTAFAHARAAGYGGDNIGGVAQIYFASE